MNIGKDKIIKGKRLYERDFGDYEGSLISEVEINALRRWTDNAPTPNGETIRELAARVFEFLDDVLPNIKVEEIERKRIEPENESSEIKILFVVHGYVLRTMHWYFNGLPEEGDETVIETDNCGFYEFVVQL